MSDGPIIAAQVSTASLSPGSGTAEWVYRAIQRVSDILPLDILIVGGRDSPDLFWALTGADRRLARQIFLWYNLLSDYPGMNESEGVVNVRGMTAPGWGGGEGESFRFACPNHPQARRKTLHVLERMLDRYPFDGVFLDKLRFPSPANGPEGLYTCFCDHCRAAASTAGFDLDAVRRMLATLQHDPGPNGPGAMLPPGAPWLEALLANHATLRHFVRFRADAVTELVAAAHRIATARNRRVGLDLFSPGLAPLVGQDFPALTQFADWAKPMTYRITRAPAGLRLEIPALVRLLATRTGQKSAAALAWVQPHVSGLHGVSLTVLEESGLPLPALEHELRQAVALLSPAPVYMGLETVAFPEVCEATPGTVLEALGAGRRAGVAGYVLSWDLLDTPLENIRAVARGLALD
jgi:hypothetical protein